MTTVTELSIKLPDPEELAKYLWNCGYNRSIEDAIRIYVLENIHELNAHVSHEYKSKYSETMYKLKFGRKCV